MPFDPAELASEFAAARERMVREQLRGRGIKDPRVLKAMAAVPREEFLPWFLKALAYQDRPRPIGYEQTISQPYIVAFMTEALGLRGSERVLEIGTGSGYQTAVLSWLCAEVFTVERIPELSARAEETLTRLNYSNIHFRTANGTFGWPEEAPFDAILVTAAAPELPRAYQEQLIQGGRLVIPIGDRRDQRLYRYTLVGKDLEREDLGRVAFVPLVGGE